MESIMNYLYEYEKYYRRSPINFFHSICFLFENEKTNWEWNEIEGHCGINGNGVWVWSSLLLAGRLWAQQRQGREPREKTREDKQTQTECLFFSFSSICEWRNEWTNWEEKWRDEIEELRSQQNEWDCFSCLLLPLWVKGGSCRTAPQREDERRQEEKQLNSWSWVEQKAKGEWNESKDNFLSLIEWNVFGWAVRGVWAGGQRNSLVVGYRRLAAIMLRKEKTSAPNYLPFSLF